MQNKMVEYRGEYYSSHGFWGSSISFIVEEDLSNIVFERVGDERDLLHSLQTPMQAEIKIRGFYAQNFNALMTHICNLYVRQTGRQEKVDFGRDEV